MRRVGYGDSALAQAALILVLACCLAGCGDAARLPESAGFGSAPQLPDPVRTLVPTIRIAPIRGWSGEQKPAPAAGLSVARYADGLDNPRSLYVLPNGDVLVAESTAPASQFTGLGVQGWARRIVIWWSGRKRDSANRITLLRDADGDGIAELRVLLLRDLNSPFGMALIGDFLYVANTDAVVRFPYTTGQTQITAPPQRVVDLPAGTINHHWTRNLLASKDGTRLYIAVGSDSDSGENGMAREAGRAAVWEVDLRTGSRRLLATGLRNPVGLDREPVTGAVWVTVNERDMLGSDLVPDYMTAVRDGGFYGWPYSYFGTHLDPRVVEQRPDLVRQAIAPDYALGTHTASLGLAFARGELLPPLWRSGAFIAQHGSWNRKPRSGYKVIFVPFENGRPSGPARDALTQFIDASDHALGRPAGLAIDTRGALLVADDAGNVVWRVAAALNEAAKR